RTSTARARNAPDSPGRPRATPRRAVAAWPAWPRSRVPASAARPAVGGHRTCHATVHHRGQEERPTMSTGRLKPPKAAYTPRGEPHEPSGDRSTERPGDALLRLIGLPGVAPGL